VVVEGRLGHVLESRETNRPLPPHRRQSLAVRATASR
jgi:hypothetical protein